MKTKRKELKTPLTNIEKINFMSSLSTGLIPIHEERTITSLYFDTVDFMLYKNSKYFDVNRYKIRYRKYSNSDKIFKEIKFTNNDSKYKEVYESKYSFLNEIKKFTYKENLLVPTLYVSYTRNYFLYKDSRLTLDTNISFCSHKFRTLSTISYSPENLNILEFKLLNNTEDIEKYIRKSPQKFSKYDFGIEKIYMLSE